MAIKEIGELLHVTAFTPEEYLSDIQLAVRAGWDVSFLNEHFPQFTISTPYTATLVKATVPKETPTKAEPKTEAKVEVKTTRTTKGTSK